jgi:hypothetical protein
LQQRWETYLWVEITSKFEKFKCQLSLSFWFKSMIPTSFFR